MAAAAPMRKDQLATAIAAGTLGNTLEGYDFAVYGFMASILSGLFFPGEDPLVSLIAIYGVFAVAFLMRPLGSVLFGWLGDTVGSSRTLVLSVAMMALPTVLLGLLPSYASIGIAAPIALVLVRMVQGLSVGGEYSTSVTYLVETAPPRRRGFAGSWLNIGSLAGMLLGSGAAEPNLLDRPDLEASQAVILSAGAIGSPTVLMHSGIGPADQLKTLGITPRVDLFSVGDNLHDHLLSGGNLYLAKRPVPPSRYQHSESLLYVDGAMAAPAPELVLACVVAPVVTEAFEAPPPDEAYTLMFGFTHPNSRGRITLSSADPRDKPRIDPNYLAEKTDRDSYLAALDLARAVGGTAALSDWRKRELLPDSSCKGTTERLRFLEQAAFTHHHPVGTCRMGSDGEAVVGPDLKLRGVEGLYVVDASLMPRITTGPVNAAVVAIAERASDLILGRAPLPPAVLT